MRAVGRKTEEFFETLDRTAIVAAIREGEAKGHGEIRVHLHHGKVADPRAKAELVFLRLGIHRTALRSGCLLFIAPEERAFVVLGDSGLDAAAGQDLWTSARDAAAVHFLAGRTTEGVVAAVQVLGEGLGRHFPRAAGEEDANELADEVSENR